MAPFSIHATGLEGIKDKLESLGIQGDRLYLGTAAGDLNIYGLNRDVESPKISLVDTKKGLCRKSIDQIGFIKDTNSLIVLSDGVVTLFNLPDLSTATPLPQAKNALSFAVHTAVLHVLPDGTYINDESENLSKSIPSVVTRLIVGCRKKLTVFTWRDGELHGTKELNLPHSPRAIAFLSSNAACLAYTQADHAMLSLENMTVSEIVLPSTSTVTVAGIGMGMSAFSGLGGYMTLGLGGKEKKPCIVRVDDGEALIPKDNAGIFIGPDGQPTRTLGIDWTAIPEEIAYAKPYLMSILPPGSSPAKLSGQSHSTLASPSTYLQIYSTISLLPVQVLTPPFTESANDTHQKPYTIRLLNATFPDKSPLFLVMTPLDRTAATTEGSSLWMLSMRPWGDQIDELVDAGSYSEALALLDTVEKAFLPDKDERRIRIRILQAVFLFSEGQFDDAINTFIEFDINPAKVIALYPASVAGRLSTPKEKWFQLHGGHPPTGFIRTDTDSTRSLQGATIAMIQDHEQDARSHQNAPRGRWMAGLDRLVPSGGPKEDDTASLSGKTKEKPVVNDFRRSVETLYRYLGDRRPKLSGALSNFHITPAQASEHPLLSATSVDDLFSMPNGPLLSLVPHQLVRYAQVVDTAFFKSYLEIRPSLLASLCRIPNWCEVSEVEEALRSRQKFTELIFLYQGKHMHEKALSLLREMSESVHDHEEKLRPTINYLQKLSAQYLPQIFDASRWVLDIDSNLGFEIFTSEEHDLPKQEVINFLETYNPSISVRYLEFLVQERNDTSFHERLAESYLDLFTSAKKQGNSELQRDMYSKLLEFMSESSYYQVDRLFARLPSDDMFEARAVLLGKLGKHEGALEIYVYRLQDYLKAEEYCKKTYQTDPESKGIFLALLRIYLHSNAPHLLKPALDLISRHSPRLPAVETLNLLPPMVTAEDLNAFLHEALRAPLFDTRVVREIWKGRSDQVSLSLIGLQSRRVKVTDSRICPQCHKRIGNSVIAVHAPRGEVTHYTCREPFSLKLKEISR